MKVLIKSYATEQPKMARLICSTASAWSSPISDKISARSVSISKRVLLRSNSRYGKSFHAPLILKWNLHLWVLRMGFYWIGVCQGTATEAYAANEGANIDSEVKETFRDLLLALMDKAKGIKRRVRGKADVLEKDYSQKGSV